MIRCFIKLCCYVKRRCGPRSYRVTTGCVRFRGKVCLMALREHRVDLSLKRLRVQDRGDWVDIRSVGLCEWDNSFTKVQPMAE